MGCCIGHCAVLDPSEMEVMDVSGIKAGLAVHKVEPRRASVHACQNVNAGVQMKACMGVDVFG